MEKCSDNTINIVVGSTHDLELEQVLFNTTWTGVTNDPVNHLPDAISIEDIVVAIGFMPSKSQARKNGFTGDIPIGLNTFTFGKKRLTVWVYKKPEGCE